MGLTYMYNRVFDRWFYNIGGYLHLRDLSRILRLSKRGNGKYV